MGLYGLGSYNYGASMYAAQQPVFKTPQINSNYFQSEAVQKKENNSKTTKAVLGIGAAAAAVAGIVVGIKTGAFSKAGNAIKAFFSEGGGTGKVADGAKGFMDKVTDGAKGIWGTVKEKLSGAFEAVKGFFSKGTSTAAGSTAASGTTAAKTAVTKTTILGSASTPSQYTKVAFGAEGAANTTINTTGAVDVAFGSKGMKNAAGVVVDEAPVAALSNGSLVRNAGALPAPKTQPLGLPATAPEAATVAPKSQKFEINISTGAKTKKTPKKTGKHSNTPKQVKHHPDPRIQAMRRKINRQLEAQGAK